MTGRKLGNYEILDKLGEGGMGQVWRARDSRLSRSVAVKILPADVAGDPGRRQRFEQEARALGALNHPNIVAVYDIGQSDGQAYIVSELVEGESLRAVIERGPLAGRKLIDIATQTAEAIAAAHALGIVHRDLKPENIMIARDGRVKVLDFGLAKQNAVPLGEEAATIALSQPGMVLGTVGYMSPEQVRGQAVDARSDIFSFGCVLYELASGRQPFQGKSSADVMSAVLKDEPPEIAPAVPMPPALDAILHRCLEKDPARRFQSAADLAFALRSISNLSSSQPVMAKAAAARRNWLFPVAAVLAAGALLAGGYFVRSRFAAAGPPQFQRLTFRQGHVTAARFAPDGQNVIYAADWDGEPGHIYFAAPGNPESRDLGAPAHSRLLAVSSKGDIALLTGPFTPDGSGTLASTTVAGGRSRGLLENVRFAGWSPDGSQMAVVRRVDGVTRLEYPVGNVLYKSEWIRSAARISPDGQRVAFAGYANGSSTQIYIVDRSGKVRSLGIVSGQVADIGLADLSWSRDGREIWYRSFDEGARNTIMAIDLNGKTRVVGRFPGHVNLYDVAADGRMLLGTESGRLGIRGVAPGETAERDLSCLESSMLRGITPDGRIILANISGESGGPKGSIYWRYTDGSPPVRLSDGYAFGISPDGKWVTGFESRETAERKYVLIPTGPGESIPLEFSRLPKKFGAVVGWLGDENYLVMGLSQVGFQYYRWNRPSGSAQPASLPTMGDSRVFISPDRRQLVAQDDHQVWVSCVIDTAQCRPIPGLSVHDWPVDWRQDNRTIYVAMHHDDNRMLMVEVVDAATGARTPWKHIQPAIAVDELSNLQITPDGRAYAYNYSYSRSDLYLARGL
jgi:hypothetical protein